jgi:hypothetical protein
MKYISRRLLVVDENQREFECSDIEFIDIDAPLIVIGEPGAGKTELMQLASTKLDTDFIIASSVTAGLDISASINTIIIDGIDEITAYERVTPINKILSQLPSDTRFILSCRAADWQDTVNKKIISQKWKKHPVVGRLLPLSNEDIISFVNASGESLSGEDFFQEAQKRDVIELLRNPQHLHLLIKTVKSTGWPKTRVDLFKDASEQLVEEYNDIHNSINRSQHSIEIKIEAAGFIFAQLLLSGKRGVRSDGKGNVDCPAIHELSSDSIDNDILTGVLSTKLFRPTGNNLFQPCHRTVAEFLGAKWLANALRNKLSQRRLESLIYGRNYIVPTALRGLHAWIATLNSRIADSFIQRDPYGFFRYGDPSVLSISQSHTLLRSLEKIAGLDPYFRNEDWHISFRNGFARKELTDEIVRLIRNPNSPYQLSHLLMESIRGTEVANEISSDLLAIVSGHMKASVDRYTALEILNECEQQTDWIKAVEDLRSLGDIDSIKLALQIIQNNVDLFHGNNIAELLIALSKCITASNTSFQFRFGYRLHKVLSTTQLEEVLSLLSRANLNADRDCTDRGEFIRDWIFKFVQERFERGSLPAAHEVWSWLCQLENHRHRQSDWENYSRQYLSKNTEFRHSLQIEALKSVSSADDMWLRLIHMGEISPGLWIREDDLILHLQIIVKNEDRFPDWEERWKILVRWGQVHTDFTGKFLEFAKNQATQSIRLSSHLSEMMAAPPRDFKSEEHKREQEYGRKQLQEKKIRYQNYEKIQDQLRAGKHLGALSEIAKTYLGRFSEFNDIKKCNREGG